MKLINEIIDILSSDNPSLINALIKTKVLLHKIDQKELIDWINNEINGYKDKEYVPPYRILPAQVLANATNISYQVTAHPIPLAHLDKEQRDSLENAKLYHSLGVLEEFASKKEGNIQSPIPMEAIPLLNKGLASGFQIQQAWCQISNTDIIQILIEVRSRLLDFALELSEKFGENMSDEEVKKVGRSLDTASMFNNAMFGDNVTILVGNQNKQNVTNYNLKGDLEALAQELRSHNVSEPDIVKLKEAIQQDEGLADEKAKQFGPAVKSWVQKMLSKAVDMSWKVELGVASSIIANALQSYYGWF